MVSEPVIYPDGGFYDSYITVTMLSIEDYDIYYTLDGSEPSESNGMRYKDSGIDLEEQKKVSSILSALDAKISLNRQINQNLPARSSAMATAHHAA